MTPTHKLQKLIRNLPIIVTALLLAAIALNAFDPQGALANAFFLPSLTATKTDTLQDDVDGDTQADPGDTLRYTISLSNSGPDPATGVTFDDTVDANTTLLAGSLAASSVAVNDIYPQTVIGNVSVNSALIPYSVVTNDFLGLNPTATITAFDATTPNGGQVSMTTSGAGIGQFTYNPPPGFEGADTFTYVLTDNPNASSAALNRTATVSINVSGMVWFIDNNAAACTTLAAGCGRLSNPFSTLAAFNALNTGAGNNPADNDNIFIYESATAYTGGVTLRQGQKLIGQDATVSLSTITSLTPPSGSAPFPAMNTGGNASTIQNTGGNGVSATDDIPSVIRGLSLSGSTNAIDITIADTSAGTTEIKDNIIVGAGAEGVDVNKGGSGTLTLDVQNNAWNVAGTHTGNAFDARTTAGALTLTFSGNTNVLSSATSVLLDGSGGGTFTVTGFASNSIHQNTAGIGVSASTVTFDATPGGTFQLVSGGSTTIGISGNGVGTSGVVLTNVSGNLSFDDLDVFADNGAGLSASGTTPYTGSAGFQLAVGAGVATIAATNGPAVSLTTVTASLPFLEIDSTNSTSTGVSLTSILGSFSAGTNSSINNASTTDFVVSSSNATITYSGSITDSAGAGVNLTNNTGSTITFNGPLSISSGASTAFSATGGGTVNVCDDNPCNPSATGLVVNTLTSTTGTALNVANTTIGSNSLEFRSISSNGATNGIVLNNTGSGGLIVTGNGGTCTADNTSGCSGGIIQNSTGSDNSSATPGGTGIVLNNAQNISLTRMWIHDHSNYGIRGTAVSGFTLDNSVINGINGNNGATPFNDGSIKFDNLTGSATVSNTNISGGFNDNFRVVNTSGTLNRITFTNVTFDVNGTTPNNDALLLETLSTAVMNVTVQNSFFKSAAGDLFQLVNNGSGATDLIFSGNTLTNNHPAIATGGGGVTINGGSGTFHIDTNTFRDAVGHAVLIVKTTDSNTLQGTFTGNVIGVAASANSGSAEGDGLKVQSAGGGTVTIAITNNQIHQYNNFGVELLTGGGATAQSGNFNAIITGNLIDTPGNTAGTIGIPKNGIHLNGGTVPGDTYAICVQIGGAGALANSIATSGKDAVPPTIGDIDFRLRQRQATTVRLPGYGGANNDNTAVQNFIIANNSGNGVPVGLASNTVPTGGGFVGGAACATPVVMLPGNQPIASDQPSGIVDDRVVDTASAGKVPIHNFDFNPIRARRGGDQSAVSGIQFADSSSPITESQLPITNYQPLLSGENINFSIGTLPAGKSLTIVFDVTVDDPLPAGTTTVCNQATIASNELSDVLTDDPDTGTASDPTCTPIDRPDTTVISLTRASGNPTTNASVTWQIVFAHPVDGLTASNFTLVNTGLGGSPTITSVTETSGPPSTTWNITASTGTGQGTLGLDMVNDTGLTHDVTNLTFTGEVFDIDHVAPTTTSFTRFNPVTSPTNADTLVFRATFNEGVTGADTADFAVDGTTTATVTAVNPVSSSVYDVTVSGGDLASFNGVVGLNFGGALDITDLAGNPLPNAEPTTDETYMLDNTAPMILSFTRFNPATSPTNADTLIFDVLFSEQVSGIGNSDFAVDGTTTATINNVAIINTNGLYRVTIDGGDLASFNGVVGLNFSGTAAMTDMAGNPFNVVEPGTDETYLLDNTAPTVAMSSTAPDPTGISPIPVTVQFSESVIGFAAGDIVPGNGTVGNFVVVDGDTYTFDLTPILPGLVTADIAAGVAQDAAGNGNTVAPQFSRTFVLMADLSITKADSAEPVPPGSPLTYTLSITNSGPAAATGVLVTDTLPVEVTWTGDTCTAGPPASQTLVWTVGTLANGASASCEVYVTVDSAGSGLLTNTAVIGSDMFDPNTGNNTAVETTITNAPPTLTNVAVTSPINENGTATLTGDISDPDGDGFQLVIDWGNGITETLSLPAGTTAFTETQQYADDDPSGTPADNFTIALTLFDTPGNSVTDSVLLTVNNLAPALSNVAITSPINENGVATLTGNISDPGPQDSFTLTINWGDGGGPQNVALSGGSTSFSVNHTYLDDNPSGTASDNYTVNLTLTDDDTGSDADSTSVTVNNVAPALSGVSATAANENSPTTLSGTIADPGTLDSFTLLVDWGNGITETFTYPAGTLLFSETFSYPDDDPTGTPSDNYTIGLILLDDDNGQDTDSTSVMVNNVAPTLSNVAITGPINEGGTATLTGNISDPGTQDTFALTVNWGDGGGPQTFNFPTGTTSFSQNHVYQDDNPTGTPSDSVTVNLTLTDDDTGQDTDSTSLTVSNVAPALSNVAVTGSVNEGGTATLTGNITDPGTGDTFTLTVDWGDGGGPQTFNYAAGTTSFSETHVYVDDNPTGTPSDSVTINLTLADDDTGSDTDSTSLTVQNWVPVLTVTYPTGGNVDENAVFTVIGGIFDPGIADTYTFVVDWADGTVVTSTYPAGTTVFTVTHTYVDDNPTGTPSDPYFPTYSLTDDDTGNATFTPSFPITVHNLAPTLSNLAATPTDENGSTTLSGTITDASPLDSFTLSVDWGDGGGPQSFNYAAGTTSFSETHQYLDDDPSGTPSDPYPVSLTLTDDDTGTGTGSTTATVNNLPPALSNLAATPVDENQTTTLSGLIADTGTLDTFTLLVNWGDSLTNTYSYPAGTGAFTETHTYLDGLLIPLVTNYTVTLTLTDDDTGQDTETIVVTVGNIAPVITSLAATSPVDENGTTTLIGTFFDPGSLDTFTVVVDWGDGSVLTATYPAGAFDLLHTHQYLDDDPTATPSDTYSITVTLTDDDGGSDSDGTAVTVNNVAPSVVAGPDQTVADTALVNFSGIFTDVGTLDTHTFLWDFGDGGTASGTLTPTHTFPAVGTYTVTLTVTDDDTGQEVDTLIVTVLPGVDLSLTKTAAPDPVLAGATLYYTLTVTNNGPSDAGTVTVTDTLPAGVTFLSASAGCAESGGIVVCTTGSLTNGSSVVHTIVVAVDRDTTGIITNSAVVSSADADPVLTNNTASAAVEAVETIIVFEDDFEDPPINSEWGCATPVESITPVGDRTFLGEFGAETVCLNLDGLPQHTTVNVAFDLYLIRSWDGNQVDSVSELMALRLGDVIGPDHWLFAADGATLLDTTFANWVNIQQSYPDNYPDGDYPAWTGAEEMNTLGYEFFGLPKDAVYRLEFTFVHTGDTLDLEFISQQLQDILDESWGLDNVVVSISMSDVFGQPYQVFLPIIAR